MASPWSTSDCSTCSGLQLSHRIRDLGKITLHRVAAKACAEVDYPHVGPLLTRRVNVDLIAEHWDDLLRLAGSLKFGTPPHR